MRHYRNVHQEIIAHLSEIDLWNLVIHHLAQGTTMSIEEKRASDDYERAYRRGWSHRYNPRPSGRKRFMLK